MSENKETESPFRSVTINQEEKKTVEPVTADQLYRMGDGCYKHAEELERYLRERQRSERSLTLVEAESGNTRGEHTNG